MQTNNRIFIFSDDSSRLYQMFEKIHIIMEDFNLLRYSHLSIECPKAFYNRGTTVMGILVNDELELGRKCEIAYVDARLPSELFERYVIPHIIDERDVYWFDDDYNIMNIT